MKLSENVLTVLKNRRCQLPIKTNLENKTKISSTRDDTNDAPFPYKKYAEVTVIADLI
jgi:hypothetical protein